MIKDKASKGGSAGASPYQRLPDRHPQGVQPWPFIASANCSHGRQDKPV
jgi:hypothetical protein